MKRRDLLKISTAAGLSAALSGPALAGPQSTPKQPAIAVGNPLQPPAEGPIPVAFLISDQAVVIDFAGPWEVFENVQRPGQDAPAFQLYTVAETLAPIQASGGMTIVPNYSIATAPAPKLIVIPAQSEPSPAVLDWIRTASRTTDVTMSICTGAFVLAKTGLLSGKSATTHHGSFSEMAMAFPDIRIKRGARFVDAGNISSSGGLSSGIDLALHVVERYFGRAVALHTVDMLEYQGQGWMSPDSNQAYAKRRVSTAAHPLCPVCDMDIDRAMAPKSSYHGRTYYFCMQPHKALFDAEPARFLVG